MERRKAAFLIPPDGRQTIAKWPFHERNIAVKQAQGGRFIPPSGRSPPQNASSAIFHSFVETAIANGLNIYKFLCYLREQRPDSSMQDDELEAMMSWSKTLTSQFQQDHLSNIN